MDRAQHAAGVALAVGERLHRVVGAGDAGLEEGIQVQAARDHQPHQVVGDRAEVVERVVALAEGEVEQGLHLQEKPLADQVYTADHPSHARWRCCLGLDLCQSVVSTILVIRFGDYALVRFMRPVTYVLQECIL